MSDHTSTVHRPAANDPVAPGGVAAALPFNEDRRIEALRGYGVLDSDAEQAYDDLTHLASTVCRTPIALISLVDTERQWFKSRVGLQAAQTPRELAFCAHAILQPGQTMEVPDALCDPRFATNPLVTGEPGIRFYAGAPLVTPRGLPVGTMCVIDRTPRRLQDGERQALASLGRQVVAQLELRQAVAHLEHDSMTDGLTGLWNRRAFDRRLQEEWTRHARSGQPLALLMMDMDRFKQVNDRFGHPAGDAVLVKAAETARAALRASDMVARFGGEEFAILLPDTDIAAATRVAEKLRLALERTTWTQGPVTASFGAAAVTPGNGRDPHVLVACADRALYAAKAGGRNRVEPFTDWA